MGIFRAGTVSRPDHRYLFQMEKCNFLQKQEELEYAIEESKNQWKRAVSDVSKFDFVLINNFPFNKKIHIDFITNHIPTTEFEILPIVETQPNQYTAELWLYFWSANCLSLLIGAEFTNSAISHL